MTKPEAYPSPSLRRPTNTRLPVKATGGYPDFVLLHGSGGFAGQWKGIAERLTEIAGVHAPDLYGTRSIGPWRGAGQFSLADEARPILDLIAAIGRPVHLVGHSYGGAVALHIARVAPEYVARATLFEPTAFHLIRDLPGIDAYERFREDLFAPFRDALRRGDVVGGIRHFVEYWNGWSAWTMLGQTGQRSFLAYAPKLMLEFDACLHDEARLSHLTELRGPVTVLRGDRSPLAARRLAVALADGLPKVRSHVITGAGHMGPFTHSRRFLEAVMFDIITTTTANDETR